MSRAAAPPRHASETATPAPCIGLTGGIGCGKSTVAGLFEAHGACIVDTDAISHALTGTDGEAIPAIRAAFGASFVTPDGAMDRARMRQLIFSDADAKVRLQRILHPLILAASQTQLAQCDAAPYAILMVPLLLESPAYLPLVRRVLVVDCDESQQVERVMRRSQLSHAEVSTIIAQQLPRAVRLAAADDVIHNNGAPETLNQQVSSLHRAYAQLRNSIIN